MRLSSRSKTKNKEKTVELPPPLFYCTSSLLCVGYKENPIDLILFDGYYEQNQVLCKRLFCVFLYSCVPLMSTTFVCLFVYFSILWISVFLAYIDRAQRQGPSGSIHGRHFDGRHGESRSHSKDLGLAV